MKCLVVFVVLVSAAVARGGDKLVAPSAGESVHRFSFDMTPRVRKWRCQDEPQADGQGGGNDWRRRMWTGYGANKDLLPFMRTSSAVQVMRGPLVIAKAEAVGTPASELRSSESLYGTEPSLRLERISVPGVWGAWSLVVGDGNGRRTPVCDFIPAGDEFKSPGFRFSLWF